MKWPWRRRRHRRDDAAAAAKATAHRAVALERAKLRQIIEISDSLERLRARNHFGEAMLELFRGRT